MTVHDHKDYHNFGRNSQNNNHSGLQSWDSNDRPVTLPSETLRTEVEDKGLDSNGDAETLHAEGHGSRAASERSEHAVAPLGASVATL